MITFINKTTGIIARQTGVDNITWLIIEANHLHDNQKNLNRITLPSFIVNNNDWEKHEINNTIENTTIIQKAISQIIKVNSKIFQTNSKLYFL